MMPYMNGRGCGRSSELDNISWISTKDMRLINIQRKKMKKN
jgi:hypothetical protein